MKIVTTKTEMEPFRAALNAKLADIEGMRINREALAIDSSPDELDRIQNAGEREYAMRTLERNTKLSNEIHAALGRMAEGTYGICMDCEEAIKPRRLAAVPWASLCIVCQEAADLALASGDSDGVESLELAA